MPYVGWRGDIASWGLRVSLGWGRAPVVGWVDAGVFPSALVVGRLDDLWRLPTVTLRHHLHGNPSAELGQLETRAESPEKLWVKRIRSTGVAGGSTNPSVHTKIRVWTQIDCCSLLMTRNFRLDSEVGSGRAGWVPSATIWSTTSASRKR